MTTTPGFRAICSDLLTEIDAKAWGVTSPPSSDAIDRARAALAQPVEELSDEELLNVWESDTSEARLTIEEVAANLTLSEGEIYNRQLTAFARAVLARYGNSPTTQP